MIYRSIIIDDDRINIDFLTELLRTYCPDVEVVATATNTEDGLKKIVQHKPQFLFLDIEIHGKTGFDILKLVQDPNMLVILITAYERYAIQAIQYGVQDYILKPVKVEDLMNAVARCREKAKRMVEQTEVHRPEAAPLKEHLSIPHKDQIELVLFSDIIHLEALGGYTGIHTIDKRKIITTRSLKENEEQLPPAQFLRVHNSHIINVRHIQKLVRVKFGVFIMSNGSSVPISSARRREVGERFNY